MNGDTVEWGNDDTGSFDDKVENIDEWLDGEDEDNEKRNNSEFGCESLTDNEMGRLLENVAHVEDGKGGEEDSVEPDDDVEDGLEAPFLFLCWWVEVEEEEDDFEYGDGEVPEEEDEDFVTREISGFKWLKVICSIVDDVGSPNWSPGHLS